MPDSSFHSEQYAVVVRMLRQWRKQSGLTQRQLAARLSQSQSYVSKTESGERRLDVLELRAFCSAVGLSFVSCAEELDRTLLQASASHEDQEPAVGRKRR